MLGLTYLPRLSRLSASPAPQAHLPRLRREMRIVSVEPYPRYTNVELHSYLCDCGRSEGFFVAHGD